jgi:transposase
VARPSRALSAVEERLHAVLPLECERHLEERASPAHEGRGDRGLPHRRHHRSSTSGRARSAERGAPAIGRSRGGPSTKIHAVVDAIGRPVCLALTEGQSHEIKLAPYLLSRIRQAYVCGDRAYDARSLVEQLRRQRCRIVIPSNPTRRIQRRFNKKLYKRRHRIENFFQRLKRYRRVATRYEKLAATFFAMICLAAALIWLL